MQCGARLRSDAPAARSRAPRRARTHRRRTCGEQHGDDRETYGATHHASHGKLKLLLLSLLRRARIALERSREAVGSCVEVPIGCATVLARIRGGTQDLGENARDRTGRTFEFLQAQWQGQKGQGQAVLFAAAFDGDASDAQLHGHPSAAARDPIRVSNQRCTVT